MAVHDPGYTDHRCFEHRLVLPYNREAQDGGECASCAIAQRDQRIKDLENEVEELRANIEGLSFELAEKEADLDVVS